MIHCLMILHYHAVKHNILISMINSNIVDGFYLALEINHIILNRMDFYINCLSNFQPPLPNNNLVFVFVLKHLFKTRINSIFNKIIRNTYLEKYQNFNVKSSFKIKGMVYVGLKRGLFT
jgi:hypothetical protein